MRKKHKHVVAIVAGTMVLTMFAGCGKADNTNPKPEEYIELGAYKGLTYEKSSGEVSEDDLQEELIYLASSFAEDEILTEGVVENGDVANIDYVGTLNGVAFDGGTASGYDLSIGSHTFIDGFEAGLVGVAIGDTVDLNLTFPENYGAADLAGQAVVFKVTVNSVKRADIPDITDEFIKEISQGEYTNVEDYKAALEEQMKAENIEYENQQIYAQLLQMAVDNATVKKDIPQEYIQAKVNRMLINVQDYAKAYNLDVETFLSQQMGLTKDEYTEQSIEYAKNAAKQSLVIQAIANAENISISDDELQEAIDVYVQQYNYKNEEEFTSSTNMDDFKEYILTSKIEDFLYENASIKEAE